MIQIGIPEPDRCGSTSCLPLKPPGTTRWPFGFQQQCGDFTTGIRHHSDGEAAHKNTDSYAQIDTVPRDQYFAAMSTDFKSFRCDAMYLYQEFLRSESFRSDSTACLMLRLFLTKQPISGTICLTLHPSWSGTIKSFLRKSDWLSGDGKSFNRLQLHLNRCEVGRRTAMVPTPSRLPHGHWRRLVPGEFRITS